MDLYTSMLETIGRTPVVNATLAITPQAARTPALAPALPDAR